MEVSEANWRDIVGWTVGRLASSFSSFQMAQCQQSLPVRQPRGFSWATTSMDFPWFPQEPLSNRDLGQSPQVHIFPCVCWCVFGGRKEGRKELTNVLRELARREEKRNNSRNERQLKAGESDSCRGLRTLTVSPAYEEIKSSLMKSPSSHHHRLSGGSMAALLQSQGQLCIKDSLWSRWQCAGAGGCQAGGTGSEISKQWNSAVCVCSTYTNKTVTFLL